MKVLLNNTTTLEQKVVEYPRGDMQPIIGLDSSLEYYIIQEVAPPAYNTNTQELSLSYELTTTPDTTYTHILTANQIWTVIDKQLPTLLELQNNHRAELTIVIQEISSIVSACKNVYDPLRTTPSNIPTDLQTLILAVQALRQRALDEINALATPQDAANYVIRGSEVENYILQLKSFL